MSPKIIQGGNFSDARGDIAFVNDFKFKDIVRFYTITNSEEHSFRAWQGHKLDCKKFFLSAEVSKHFISKSKIGKTHQKILKLVQLFYLHSIVK